MTLSTQTYVEWLRSAPRDKLDRVDLKKLADDQEWIEANPEEYARLNAYIGKTVRLVRDRKQFDKRVLPEGTEFTVFERMQDVLFGRSSGGTAYALQSNWIEVVDLPKKKTASG